MNAASPVWGSRKTSGRRHRNGTTSGIDELDRLDEAATA